jgi:hypothetical protein
MKTDKPIASTAPKAIADADRVRMGDGGSGKIVISQPKPVADTGRVRMGDGGGARVKKR